MIELKDLIQLLSDLYLTTPVVDYCPNGLQVEGKAKIGKIATAVSASLETIEIAVKNNVDALIVHHGMFWNKDSYVIQGTKRKKLSLLLEHQISLLAYHLPMDIHKEMGNNWKAASEMGWKNLAPFSPLSSNVFLGVKGELPDLSQEDLVRKLEDYYGHNAVTALGGKKKIKTIGLISGGAHRQMNDAIQEGLDAYITGSFDEPVWHQAFEDKINFFALGHSATEEVGPKALATYLQEKFPKLAVSFHQVINPF